jgi:type III restriction enzyme
LNAIDLTKEHFQSLYGGVPLDHWVYDSAQVSKLRQFSASNQMQLMVMNIQAFDKSSTIMQSQRDQMNSRKPIEFIQHARPVVVLDEPQNLATELRTKAIESLHPLCTLRYSATHKDYFNLLYRLDPVKAYDLRLVKRIEVDSVVDGGDFNQPYIAVKTITATKTRISAKLEIDVEGADTIKRKPVTVTAESSLFTDMLKRGYPLCALCLHPIGYYGDTWAGVMCPTDEVIAHLLMMRGSEEKFWANANQHPIDHPAAGV